MSDIVHIVYVWDIYHEQRNILNFTEYIFNSGIYLGQVMLIYNYAINSQLLRLKESVTVHLNGVALYIYHPLLIAFFYDGRKKEMRSDTKWKGWNRKKKHNKLKSVSNLTRYPRAEQFRSCHNNWGSKHTRDLTVSNC